MRALLNRHRILPAILAAFALPAVALAQSAPPAGDPAPGSVAVHNVALYTAGANLKEASDSGRSALATAVLRGKLAELLGPALVDSAAVERGAHDPRLRTLAGDQACNVSGVRSSHPERSEGGMSLGMLPSLRSG